MGEGRRLILKIAFIAESLLQSDYVEKGMNQRSTRTRHITRVLSNCNIRKNIQVSLWGKFPAQSWPGSVVALVTHATERPGYGWWEWRRAVKHTQRILKAWYQKKMESILRIFKNIDYMLRC